MQAKFANGMLDLTMPAAVTIGPEKIEIRIEGPVDRAKAIKAA
jgi:hypothetical protein